MDLARGQGMGDELAGPGVHRQVQLAPDPALVLAMHAHLPLALAVDLEPGGVDGEVQRAAGRAALSAGTASVAARREKVE